MDTDTAGPAGVLALLRTHRGLARLVAARTVSYLGDAAGLVALMLYIAQGTGSALAVALLLLAAQVAPGLLGPWAGAVADRFDHRRVMLACEAVQAVMTVLIAAWLPSPALLLGLVAARAVAAQVFGPASRAVVPTLVADRDLAAANTAIGFGTHAGEILGPLAGALALPALGVRGLLLVDAATFLVSMALIAGLPTRRPQPHPADREALLGSGAAGLRYLLTTRVVRAVAFGFFGVVAWNGMDDVALVFLATGPLQAGPAGVGLLLAAVGIGLVAGYALLARFPERVPMAALLVGGFAVSSAGNLLTGTAWAVWAAFALQAVRGIGIAGMDVAVNTILQRTVPPAMLGRVFGNLYAGIGLAAGLSYLGGGLLLDATGPRTAFLVAGAGGLLVAAATAVALLAAARARRAAGG